MSLWTQNDFAGTRWTTRKTTAIYLGQHGNDNNDGHPARPVATLARAAQLARAGGTQEQFDSLFLFPVVVSSGVYYQSADLQNILVIGDGFVVFDGAGNIVFNQTQTSCGLASVTVKNYTSLSNYSAIAAQNCIIRSIDYLSVGGGTVAAWYFTNCLLINAPRLAMPPFIHLEVRWVNCTVLGAKVQCTDFRNGYGASQLYRNCFFDENCDLGKPQEPTYWRLFNCNILGRLNGDNLAQHEALVQPATIQCFSTQPGFNNPAADDYTLALTSPMRNLAADGSYVGAYGIGLNFGGQSDAQTQTNVQWDGAQNGFVLSNNQLRGSIEFVLKDLGRPFVLKAPILVGAEDLPDFETIDATLNFESDSNGAPTDTASGSLVPGAVYWVNSYASVTYNGQQYQTGQFFACLGGVTSYGVSGSGKVVRLIEAPNIRVFEMKTSVVSASDCTGKAWAYFVYNQPPTIDSNGRSNGNALFDPTTAVPVAARWVKIRATILPNSLP